ncbi:hypothetical protein, partial [Flagellimonas sp.]|uniref:hypothetical protein n=1 Tax=Flagellimonas sp. TaxID=2058762 RepID=UPI003AB5DD59
ITPNGNDFDLSGFSGDFGDLTNVPANLDLDSTDDFDGQWSSLTGVPADFADNVDNVDDADASVTNEINTRFEVSGANLEIEDSNGTLQVPLANINIDQTASEVDSDNPVDVNGDGTAEDTVEEVIQAIAPITAKAARIFYPPSIAIDASTNGTFNLDLYQEYIDQYGSPAVGSTGAPATIPTYSRSELYYYVTYADPTVFDISAMAIDANGNLTYKIDAQPSDYNALINVVFVVK